MTARPPLVLNVDDYLPGRYARSRVLREAGFIVLEAANGEEALRLARERLPDVVLLDNNLPDIPGIEVCRVIKGAAETEEETRASINIDCTTSFVSDYIFRLNFAGLFGDDVKTMSAEFGRPRA